MQGATHAYMAVTVRRRVRQGLMRDHGVGGVMLLVMGPGENSDSDNEGEQEKDG